MKRMLTLLALLATALLGPVAPAAHAAVGSIICTGATTVSYSPGLTLTPRTVTYTVTDAYTCTSTDPTLTSSAPSSAQFTIVGSCLNPLATGPLSFTLDWNNGHSSTFALTFTDTIAAGIETVTGTGTVTAGELSGATAVFTQIYTTPNPLTCLTTTGVTSQTGTNTATILHT